MDSTGQEEIAIKRLTELIKLHSKVTPPRLRLDHLAAAYDRTHGNFHTCGLGKLKKFVLQHFCFSERSQEVSCKTGRKKKKKNREATAEAIESEPQCTDLPEDNRDSENGIVSVSVEEQPPARPSPAAEKRAVVPVGSISELLPVIILFCLFSSSLCLQMYR